MWFEAPPLNPPPPWRPHQALSTSVVVLKLNKMAVCWGAASWEAGGEDTVRFSRHWEFRRKRREGEDRPTDVLFRGRVNFLPSVLRVESTQTRPCPKRRYQGFSSVQHQRPTDLLHPAARTASITKAEEAGASAIGEDKRCHCCVLEVRWGGELVRCLGTTCRFLLKCSSIRGS